MKIRYFLHKIKLAINYIIQSKIIRNWQEKTGVLSYPPKWLTVTIDSRCNNRCLFCAYHCEDAVGISKVAKLPFKISLENFKKIIDMAYRGNIPHVHICATGEPFLCENILEFIDYTIEVYGEVSIQSNFFKPLFEKKKYLQEIIKRKDYISYITTDILSGDPETHNKIKNGSCYTDIIEALSIISRETEIPVNISYVLTKYNYLNMKNLIDDLVDNKIRNISIHISNLFSYDFNELSSCSAVYTSSDIEITKALEEMKEYGQAHGYEIYTPLPADLNNRGCYVFSEKLQLWPVKGNDPARYHENMIPCACRAVVRGELNSLGYLFDYDNIMDAWNNDKLVKIRKNLARGKYPSKECRYCYHYVKEDSVFK